MLQLVTRRRGCSHLAQAAGSSSGSQGLDVPEAGKVLEASCSMPPGSAQHSAGSHSAAASQACLPAGTEPASSQHQQKPCSPFACSLAEDERSSCAPAHTRGHASTARGLTCGHDMGAASVKCPEQPAPPAKLPKGTSSDLSDQAAATQAAGGVQLQLVKEKNTLRAQIAQQQHNQRDQQHAPQQQQLNCAEQQQQPEMNSCLVSINGSRSSCSAAAALHLAAQHDRAAQQPQGSGIPYGAAAAAAAARDDTCVVECSSSFGRCLPELGLCAGDTSHKPALFNDTPFTGVSAAAAGAAIQLKRLASSMEQQLWQPMTGQQGSGSEACGEAAAAPQVSSPAPTAHKKGRLVGSSDSGFRMGPSPEPQPNLVAGAAQQEELPDQTMTQHQASPGVDVWVQLHKMLQPKCRART